MHSYKYFSLIKNEKALIFRYANYHLDRSLKKTFTLIRFLVSTALKLEKSKLPWSSLTH